MPTIRLANTKCYNTEHTQGAHLFALVSNSEPTHAANICDDLLKASTPSCRAARPRASTPWAMIYVSQHQPMP